MHRNLNFSAFWRHWQALIRNNSSIANALKFTFHAYAFTWQILLRILFALKFKTPRMNPEESETAIGWKINWSKKCRQTRFSMSFFAQKVLLYFWYIIKKKFYSETKDIREMDALVTCCSSYMLLLLYVWYIIKSLFLLII